MEQRTFNTPMMQQYIKIKEQYPEALLFYRLGDFYELFLEDAIIGARVLGITLTRRPRGKDGDIPMAGVPFHAVDQYLRKLVDAGYSIAVCEQVSDPKLKGIVEREVIRIVTPGTFVETRDAQENIYIFSLYLDKKEIGLSIADLSTGEFTAQSYQQVTLEEVISREAARYAPKECVVTEAIYNNPEYLHILNRYFENISCYSDFETDPRNAAKILKEKLRLISLQATGIETKESAQVAAAALLGYLEYTQQGSISHIKKLTLLTETESMVLDSSTITNLELFAALRSGDKKGSLCSTIDRTNNPIGTRKLKALIRSPLIQKDEIEIRLDAVEQLYKKVTLRTEAQRHLAEIVDIERLLSRLSVGVGNPRDLKGIELALASLFQLAQLLFKNESVLLKEIAKDFDQKNLHLLHHALKSRLSEEPPIDAKTGGIFSKGVYPDVDALRTIVDSGKTWLGEFEKKEKERTGISTLKCGFNLVFGYYIEISKGQKEKAPTDYLRKQTLVNAERFITPELKVQEDKILSAQEKLQKLEYQLYIELVEELLTYSEVLQEASEQVGLLDCLAGFAQLAQEQQYARPAFVHDGSIVLKQSRHPVVEQTLLYEQFVPNDVFLNNNDHQLLILTGPNMAGKSVYMRQVALCVLLAQIGSFIPATEAKLSIVDKIFVRSGASDSITTGLSTFMVEMVETAYILNHATKDSLIIMDEIGRGTSTYDGISIAWAVAEHIISSTLGAKTLFATHYHELQALEESFTKKHAKAKKVSGKIKNYHMSIAEGEQGPIFLHTLKKGGASHSFGIAVGTLAGLPESVIKRAEKILQTLEIKKDTPKSTTDSVITKLRELDLDRLTPVEALNILANLKKEHE